MGKCNELDIKFKTSTSQMKPLREGKDEIKGETYIHPARCVSRKIHVPPQVNQETTDPQHRKIRHKT